jgi:hypothetical protein
MNVSVTSLQIAGIAILALIGLGFIFWIVRSTIESKRGRTLYMLGEAGRQDDDQDDDDDAEGLDVR